MSSLPSFVLSGTPLASSLEDGKAPDVVVVASVPLEDEDGVSVASEARELAGVLGVALDRRLERAKATGKAAEVVELQVDPGRSAVERLLVAGLGDGAGHRHGHGRGDVRDHRRAGAALARRTRGARRVVVAATSRTDAASLRAFVEGWCLASYSFSRKSGGGQTPARAVELLVADVTPDLEEALRTALVTVRAVHLARDLANTPSNEKSPRWLARQAEKAVTGPRVTVTVREVDRLEAEGFGGLLAVGSGSSRPPCFIEAKYVPRGATSATPHVVLVGKGITFDTGGLSLKPGEGMMTMKTDMAAGGAVIAVMAALAELEVPVKVTGLVAAAENMPSGSAYRPGDVVTHYGGTTVEVFNTDAEGRMVLADALAYADRRLAPDVVIDLATLTGAATLGLGKRHAAMYATDDRIATALDAAATASGERVWRMPLTEDYRPALDSDIADLAHISRDRTVQGGSITAALFLQAFVGDRPWVHFDIAGPGRADGDEHEVTRGATGWGTRTLLRWLEESAPGVRRRA